MWLGVFFFGLVILIHLYEYAYIWFVYNINTIYFLYCTDIALNSMLKTMKSTSEGCDLLTEMV